MRLACTRRCWNQEKLDAVQWEAGYGDRVACCLGSHSEVKMKLIDPPEGKSGSQQRRTPGGGSDNSQPFVEG